MALNRMFGEGAEPEKPCANLPHNTGRLLTLIVVGSIWGLAEMTLGSFLHIIHFPHKGAVMGGLAISLMAVFSALTGKPSLVPLLGVIAASFKPFSAIIFGMSLLSPFVVNPSIAIITEALAFSGVVAGLGEAINRHIFARAGAGILAGFLGYVFYAGLASIFGLGVWPSLDFMAKFQLVLDDATPTAIAGAIMLLTGYSMGKAALPRISGLRGSHPRLYYSASLVIVLFAWLIPIVFR